MSSSGNFLTLNKIAHMLPGNFFAETVRREFLSEGLYIAYKLDEKTKNWMRKWMEDNKIPNPISIDDLHVTLIATEINPIGFKINNNIIVVNPNTYKFKHLGHATVITFKSLPLEAEYERIKAYGGKSDFPAFIPHMSLSYSIFNFDHLTPPNFPLTLVKPYETELKENSISEIVLSLLKINK